MILGIDASNIRGGGGLTHLTELLRACRPAEHGFSQVVVWGGSRTLRRIDDRPWLDKRHELVLDRALPYRVFWQRFKLSDAARSANCSVLFVPGGSYAGSFAPVVAMSQNLLPFEWAELRRFGLTAFLWKMVALRRVQSRTFGMADGVVFLTRYAQNAVMSVIKSTRAQMAIVPHGINARFSGEVGEQRSIASYSQQDPFRILYVSTVTVYKHQWHVVEAVRRLRDKGLPVVLECVGGAYSPALKRLRRAIGKFDPNGEFVRYAGALPFDDLHHSYASADLGIFASSCENMPNILLEMMASGLPAACSNRGPMPEVLGDAGVYFDPEKPADIAEAIDQLIESSVLRREKATQALELVNQYSWSRCADESFSFLAEIAAANKP